MGSGGSALARPGSRGRGSRAARARSAGLAGRALGATLLGGGFWYFFCLPATESVSVVEAQRTAGGGRNSRAARPRGRDRGAAPRALGGSRRPARPPPRRPAGSPPPRPTRSRAASLGEAAARPPPRAGSSPARLGGPGAPPAVTPAAPALRERSLGLAESPNCSETIFGWEQRGKKETGKRRKGGQRWGAGRPWRGCQGPPFVF